MGDNDVKKVKDRQQRKKKKEDKKKDEEDEDEASADDSNLDLIGMFDDNDDDDDNRKNRETGKNIKKQLGDIEKDQDSAADDTDDQKEDTEEFPAENKLDANGNRDVNGGDNEDGSKKVADYHSDLAQSARQRPIRDRKPMAPYSAESKISALATASSSTRENSTSKMKKKTTSAGIN